MLFCSLRSFASSALSTLYCGICGCAASSGASIFLARPMRASSAFAVERLGREVVIAGQLVRYRCARRWHRADNATPWPKAPSRIRTAPTLDAPSVRRQHIRPDRAHIGRPVPSRASPRVRARSLAFVVNPQRRTGSCRNSPPGIRDRLLGHQLEIGETGEIDRMDRTLPAIACSSVAWLARVVKFTGTSRSAR